MLVLMFGLALAGCAVMPEEPQGVPGEREFEPAVASESEPDADVLFHIMAAEQFGAAGDIDQALDNYRQAAMISEDPEISEQLARLAVTAGDWETLLDAAARWRELDPESADPQRLEILAWLRLGFIEPPAAGLEKLIEQAPNRRAGWRDALSLVASAATEAHAESVMEALLERLGKHEGSATGDYYRSHLAWQLDQPERARVLAEAAASAEPERRHRVWAAQLAVADDDYDGALAWYRRAREETPEDLALGLAEAEVLRQLGREQEAIALLESLPDSVDGLYTLGGYQQQFAAYEDAILTWQRLAAFKPVEGDRLHHAFLTAHLADLLELEAEAIEWYRRVDGGPSLQQARIRKAALMGRTGALDEARELLAQVREQASRVERQQAWLIESDLLRQLDRPADAVALLSRALVDLSGSIPLLYTRAIAAVEMDDLELAEQDLRRIIQIDPENAMALNALGYTLTDRTDRHQEAYRLIRRALDLDPEEPAIIDSMGWVYFRLGQPDKALGYLERALEGEDNPEIAAHLGEVLWVLGQRERALQVLIDARSRFPDDDYLADTIDRLGINDP